MDPYENPGLQYCHASHGALGISLAAQEKKTSATAGTQPAPGLGITVRRLSPRAAVFKRNCARRGTNSREFDTNRRS
jgi:hypothetical protein